MKKALLIIILISSFSNTHAQGNTTTTPENPLDMSLQLKNIENYGVPTIASVDAMKIEAETLYNNQQYKEAIVAFRLFIENANWLANILSQCVEPYYSASYDDRNNISYSILKSYVPYENAANKYKEERNIAYLMIGQCYKEIGDIPNAVAYLYQALDLLSVDQEIYWYKAARLLSELVGFDPNYL